MGRVPKVFIRRSGKGKNRKYCRYYYNETFRTFKEAKEFALERKKDGNRYYIMLTGELMNRDFIKYHVYLTNEVSIL